MATELVNKYDVCVCCASEASCLAKPSIECYCKD